MGDGWVLVIQRTALHDTPANLQTLNYYTTQTATGDFDDILQQVVDSLKDEGFGVLCDIDVSATFAEKLDIQDYRRYRIFGACNSAMTHQGVDLEIDLGVFLPCNMVIYETDAGEVVVSALKP